MAPDLEGLAVRFADGETATATVSAPAGVVIEAGGAGARIRELGAAPERAYSKRPVTFSMMP